MSRAKPASFTVSFFKDTCFDVNRVDRYRVYSTVGKYNAKKLLDKSLWASIYCPWQKCLAPIITKNKKVGSLHQPNNRSDVQLPQWLSPLPRLYMLSVLVPITSPPKIDILIRFLLFV